MNATIKHLLLSHNLEVPQIERFFQLERYLQYIIYMKLKETASTDWLITLFDTLRLSSTDRQTHFLKMREEGAILPWYIGTLPISDVGVVLLALNLLSHKIFETELNQFRVLMTQWGALMLIQNLLPLDQLYDEHISGTRAKLGYLVCKNGYIALRSGLLLVQDALYIEALYIEALTALLSDNGLKALRNRWITAKQARRMCQSALEEGRLNNLRALLSDYGLKALERKFCVHKQVGYVSSVEEALNDDELSLMSKELVPMPYAEIVNNKYGRTILSRKLLTESQMNEINDLHALLTENGLKALSSGLLTPEQAMQGIDLISLLSDEGIIGLEERVITEAQMLKHKRLALIKMKNGVKALKEGLITLDQAERFFNYGDMLHPCPLEALLTESGLEALREKVITPEQASQFYPSGNCDGPYNNLHLLLSPIGVKALKKGLITPEQALSIKLELLFSVEHDNVLVALENSLIALDDFKHGKKYDAPYYRCSQQHFLEEVDQLVAIHVERTKAAITIQKHWRGYLGRTQFALFKGKLDELKNEDIHGVNGCRAAKESS